MLFNTPLSIPVFLQRATHMLILVFVCSQSSQVLGKNWTKNGHSWSLPEECARTCYDGEQPRTCYYHFTLEYYATLTSACQFCRPKNTDQLSNKPKCQCVEADGYERVILSINRMLPGPSIQVCEHDRIIVDVENKMLGMETSLHWHGVFQQGYQYYDGVPFLTQCPIASGTTFRYQFVADNAGTHYYHSHAGLQKKDGLFGTVIVRQTPSKDPNWLLYDEDLLTHVIFINDWLHVSEFNRFPGLAVRNPGQDPESFLINGKGRWTDHATNKTTNSTIESFDVEAGKKYRFRMIDDISTSCPVEFRIAGHVLTLIAQDGQSVKPVQVDTIIISSGERVDFILNCDAPIGSYWIHLRGLESCVKVKINQVAIVRYKGAPAIPDTRQPSYDDKIQQGTIYNPLDGICNVLRPNVVCANQLISWEKVTGDLLQVQPDQRIVLPFQLFDYNNTYLFEPGTYKRFTKTTSGNPGTATFDSISFLPPTSLSILQDFAEDETCNRNSKPTDCVEPCECFHVYHIKKGAVVEVVIYTDQSVMSHPFHLHGNAFRIFAIGRFEIQTSLSRSNIYDVIQDHEKMLDAGQYHLPPGKDTINVPKQGYVIYRFKADNPGWWYFHCHILYHLILGMAVVFHVGEKSDLPPVPKNFPQCSSYQPQPSFVN